MTSSWRSFQVILVCVIVLLFPSLAYTHIRNEKPNTPNGKYERRYPFIQKPTKLQTTTRVDRLRFSSETCSESRRAPIIVLDSTCPCFVQYTLQSQQTVTWDVFLLPRTSYLRWRRIQFTGDPTNIISDLSSLNKTVPAFGYLETPDQNAFIDGEFTLAIRTNTDSRVCLSSRPPPEGSTIVFEPMPTPCPIILPPNETAIEPRIVGGTRVTKGFEWMTVIWLIAIEEPIVVCGGVHISPGYVVTAAHCNIQNAPSAYRVRVGALQADKGAFIKIRRVFTHPRYQTLQSREAVYDIAILELLSVPEAPVLEINKDNTLPTIGSWVSTAGFGYLSEDWSGLPSPNALRRVDIRVIGAECERRYEDANLGIHVCAGLPEGGCDSCLSDSGGPLIGLKNGSFHLVGVVSYGNGCARSETPGVYTRVSAVASWVEETITSARASKKGPPVGALVGGLVGGIGVVFVVAIVVVVVMKKRRPRPVVRTGSSVPSQTGISE